MRELHGGGIEFALPGVEHWHGASPTEGARHINQGLRIDGGSGTFWMEEVPSAGLRDSELTHLYSSVLQFPGISFWT